MSNRMYSDCPGRTKNSGRNSPLFSKVFSMKFLENRGEFFLQLFFKGQMATFSSFPASQRQYFECVASIAVNPLSVYRESRFARREELKTGVWLFSPSLSSKRDMLWNCTVLAFFLAIMSPFGYASSAMCG